jgi:DNA-binding transcriptional ArsR family regulator
MDDTNLEAKPADERVERTLDMESLKGLAHPLRVQILDALSVHGAATASGLAERLGESSGATSYHLRQLAKHGFVREVEGKGVGRERWWERVPGGIQLSAYELEQSPAALAASHLVLAEWERNRSRLLGDFLDRGFQELPEHWVKASAVATANLRLTAEQLESITKRWDEVVDTMIEQYRGQEGPGTRPVQIHFNAFPVMDGAETPLETTEEN